MRPRLLAAALAALAVLPLLAGCALPFDRLTRPDLAVARTAVATGPGTWNTEGRFTVQVNEAEPAEVLIEAEPLPAGPPLTAAGLSHFDEAVSLAIPDGTWTITYWVDGHEWETFRAARFDSTPPRLEGLETLGEAPDGSYLLGAGATAEPSAALLVLEQSTGAQVATRLPAQLSGLADGVHAYDVVVSDAAGNEAFYTVQVVVGAATRLPEGRFTLGIVARYTVTADLWDLTDLDAYPMPAEAQSAMPGHLGSGTGITPDDPQVRQVVDGAVRSGMTTAEIALALYRWMFDELEYDRARLESGDDGLLSPAQTIEAGGGVCRDLAALYVSLLRAAGVPSRLVAGYLGGRVGGFHAWVEFYGGEGHGPTPWVPVDVSGIGSSDDPADDLYSDAAMLQSFGVRQPEYLMLRPVTPSQEQSEWSSVATLQYSARRGSPPPDAPFDEHVADVVPPVRSNLCVDAATRYRVFQQDVADCPTPRRSHIPDVVVQSVRVLDYGLDVRSMAPGTNLTFQVVYPDVGDTSAERVDFVYYAPQDSGGCRPDAARGRAACTLEA